MRIDNKARAFSRSAASRADGASPGAAALARPAWVDALGPASGPRYLQVADAIEQAILRGELVGGDRLPPQRTLAAWVGVDLTTITRAYAEARRRNLLEATVGQGSFVARQRSEPSLLADLSMNIPPSLPGGRLHGLLQQGVADVLARVDANTLMTYHWGTGSAADRQAGAAWLAPALGAVALERVAVAPGAQAALAALILAQSEPGDAVATESLSYPGVLQAVQQTGRRLVSVATDAEGMRPDALEQACREQRVRLLYLNPTIQNPTTVTMTQARRADIVAVARRHGLNIIEDDPYWLLADQAPAPLASLAPDITCYVATLSKCLTPGLRTAFVALPDALPLDRFALSLRAFALMGAPLMTALATEWIRNGTAASFSREVRAESRARHALAASILPLAPAPGPCGFHIWHELPPQWSLHALIAAASLQGLGITSSEAFTTEGAAPKAIRVSLGAMPDQRRLRDALVVLANLLAQSRPTPLGVVV